MAKLKTNQITKDDLTEYLNSYSDFSFELAVLKMLRERNFECEHGGHYEDPVTNKPREFDIRATKTTNNPQAKEAKLRVRLAVECKNIRENFPILISCMPRHEHECFHQIALVREPVQSSSFAAPTIQSPRANVLDIRGSYSLYKMGEAVGKSTVQVGRTMDNTISANDSELYEKWGQCLSSATDLINKLYWDGHSNNEAYISAVFPFVVVPNERLWMVTYDEDGNRICDPTPTDRVSCFINKGYRMGSSWASTTISLSHVEIVTFNGMASFADRYLHSEMTEIFPAEGMGDAYVRKIKKSS